MKGASTSISLRIDSTSRIETTSSALRTASSTQQANFPTTVIIRGTTGITKQASSATSQLATSAFLQSIVDPTGGMIASVHPSIHNIIATTNIPLVPTIDIQTTISTHRVSTTGISTTFSTKQTSPVTSRGPTNDIPTTTSAATSTKSTEPSQPQLSTQITTISFTLKQPHPPPPPAHTHTHVSAIQSITTSRATDQATTQPPQGSSLVQSQHDIYRSSLSISSIPVPNHSEFFTDLNTLAQQK